MKQVMKKIFIYYSLTGNGDIVANYLKDKKYDIRKVNTKEKLPDNFILRMLSGGYKAMINYKDKLDNFNNDISLYDEIVIGSPIWNDRLSSPINKVLDELALQNKGVTFILYSGSNKLNRAINLINKRYKNAKIIKLVEPKKNKEELKKLDNL